MVEQTTLPISTPTYTNDQVKAARDALTMWQALPCNPNGVSNALNQAILAETRATGSFENLGPAVLIINWALQRMVQRDLHYQFAIGDLIDAVEGCRERVRGTEYWSDWMGE